MECSGWALVATPVETTRGGRVCEMALCTLCRCAEDVEDVRREVQIMWVAARPFAVAAAVALCCLRIARSTCSMPTVQPPWVAGAGSKAMAHSRARLLIASARCSFAQPAGAGA